MLDTLKKKFLIICGIVFLSFCLYFGTKWIHFRFTHAITDACFVKSDLVEISSLVSGRIKTLFVDESDHVKEDQLVALIDDIDYRAEVNLKCETLDKSKKQLEEAKKNLNKCEESLKLTQVQVPQQISEAESALTEAREILNKAETEMERITKDYERLNNLYEEGVVEKKILDDVTAAFRTAMADITAAKALISMREARLRNVSALVHRIEIDRQNTALAKARIETLKSTVKESDRAIDIAKVKLGHTHILVKGLMSGIVAKRYVEEGEFVSPGFPLFTLYDADNLYVIANLEEGKIGPVRLGMPVNLKVDAFPRERFQGKVIRIGEATGAEFALIPRDISTGEFTKVVQRVPIKVAIIDSRGLLKPGLSVTVGIELKSH